MYTFSNHLNAQIHSQHNYVVILNHISTNMFPGPVWKIHLSIGKPTSLSLKQMSTAQQPKLVTELLVFKFVIQCHFSDNARIVRFSTDCSLREEHIFICDRHEIVFSGCGEHSHTCNILLHDSEWHQDVSQTLSRLWCCWRALPFLRAESLGLLYCCIHHWHVTP